MNANQIELAKSVRDYWQTVADQTLTPSKRQKRLDEVAALTELMAAAQRCEVLAEAWERESQSLGHDTWVTDTYGNCASELREALRGREGGEE